MELFLAAAHCHRFAPWRLGVFCQQVLYTSMI